MKKTIALFTAISLSLGLVSAPSAVGQSLSHADLYDPEIYPIGALTAGPSDSLVSLLVSQGPEFSEMEILEFDSPYPVSYRKIDVSGFTHAIYINLENQKIYPKQFRIAVKVLVHYKDGTSEEVSGSFPVNPVAALVTGTPKPSSTPKPSPSPVTTTKTVVATTTVTAKAPAPVTTTVTEKVTEPTTATVTVTEKAPAPVTTTVTGDAPAPVTSTVTEKVTTTVTETPKAPAPVTTTVTEAAPTVTSTVTAAPKTVTATPTAKNVPGQSSKDTALPTALAAIFGILAGVVGAITAVMNIPELRKMLRR